MNTNKKLFLSIVSSEFKSYRELLSDDLKRPNLDVAVQEDFIVTGGSTLEKLDTYIQHCDAVVHLIGKATGSIPEEHAVAALLRAYPDFAERLPPLAEALAKTQPGFSYTQWESYLALYHRRPLFVYCPSDFDRDALKAPRDSRFALDPAQEQSQREHHKRIAALGHDRGEFLNQERLSSAVLRDLVEILPRLESAVIVSPTRLRHTAERLIGRDEDLTRLDAAWNDPNKNVVVVRAFGGMGKTSLVATWMAEMALKDWRGATRVFDWSFYSQGTREQGAASSDTFIDAALREFGDRDPTLGSPWDRGVRLAHLVGEHRCLLVLDGLEPLQHPPGPMEGKLKDQAIEALLKGLAAHNAGLCIVTTREKVDDIKQHYGRCADDIELLRLTDLAGAALLHYAGATRAGAKAIAPNDAELQAASREVRGHGLTLQLLGQYLRLAEGGDIRRRDTVRLADADKEYQSDATRPYGHVFKAMEAYEKWFIGEGERGRRQLAALRLLGLFDRPASASCLDALRARPEINRLTEDLVGLTPRAWNLLLSRLEEINLIAVNRDDAGVILSLDAHPLLREYFARQLREKLPEAWREGHRRLYQHLCASTHEGDEPTLEELQPLYQAVVHGCQAGSQREAREKVYQDRILRGTGSDGFYSMNKLGAFGSDLGAVACFFKQPWSRVSTALTEANQAWMLGVAAFNLRALGRLTEALEPMRAGLEMLVNQENWRQAAIAAGNLSELELTLGDVARAVGDAEQSVCYADRCGVAFHRMTKRTTHADALHQAGHRAEAEALFRDAERMQKKRQREYPMLYSIQGFKYCDLLLAAPERDAWQVWNQSDAKSQESELIEACCGVSQRAKKMFEWRVRSDSLLTIALDHLTLGRAALYLAILESSDSHLPTAASELNSAVDGARRAGINDYTVRGLLTRASLRCLEGHFTGPDGAQEDLDEAWEIADRGLMKLLMADIHLYRARLFGAGISHPGSVDKYPWESPEADLEAAAKLIESCGYWRRKEELADARLAILGSGSM